MNEYVCVHIKKLKINNNYIKYIYKKMKWHSYYIAITTNKLIII